VGLCPSRFLFELGGVGGCPALGRFCPFGLALSQVLLVLALRLGCRDLTLSVLLGLSLGLLLISLGCGLGTLLGYLDAKLLGLDLRLDALALYLSLLLELRGLGASLGGVAAGLALCLLKATLAREVFVA